MRMIKTQKERAGADSFTIFNNSVMNNIQFLITKQMYLNFSRKIIHICEFKYIKLKLILNI